MREALSCSQKRTPLRLFPELKRRDGAGNEPPLIRSQKIGKAGWDTARMLGMVFEVVQPDLEINRRHLATLLIPSDNQQCATHFGHCRGSELHAEAGIERSARRRQRPKCGAGEPGWIGGRLPGTAQRTRILPIE